MKLNKKEISEYIQKFLKEDKSNEDIHLNILLIRNKMQGQSFYLKKI